MSFEKIIEELDKLARKHEVCGRSPSLKPLAETYRRTAKILRAAIALLETHPDNQPNEPLTLEELLEMAGQPIWTVTHGCGPGRWELFLGVETIGTPAHEVLRLAVPPGEIDDISIETYRVTWAAYRRPAVDLYPAQMKMKFEMEEA